jgi:hypothetical protein
MKQIILTRGKVAIVDDDEYDNLSRYKWCADIACNGRTFYAVRVKQEKNKIRKIYMHREILKCPNGLMVDHKDMNGINNLKSNIRICTKSQNMFNSPRRKNNKSGIKGIYFRKDTGKYTAEIVENKNKHCLGCFDTIDEAKNIIESARKFYHKEFHN